MENEGREAEDASSKSEGNDPRLIKVIDIKEERDTERKKEARRRGGARHRVDYHGLEE